MTAYISHRTASTACTCASSFLPCDFTLSYGLPSNIHVLEAARLEQHMLLSHQMQMCLHHRGIKHKCVVFTIFPTQVSTKQLLCSRQWATHKRCCQLMPKQLLLYIKAALISFY